jgi:hypothetical protein
MQGHVFKPIGANRMYDWQHCAVCNLLSDNPIHVMTFAGMETAVELQAEAAAQYQGEELTSKLLEPLGDINHRAARMEEDSPLFYGKVNATLFGG